jgi:xylose isomerase
MYNKFCVTERSMPFWCVANPLSDPFGGNVQPKPDSLDVARLLAWAKGEGLLETTSFHDDDLVPWNPERPEDDLDPKSDVHKKLVAIRAVLRKAGLKVNMATCSLHGNPLFRAGGLTNPDPALRALAAQKVERTLRIGAFLGARHYTYWVARDGFESYAATDFTKVYDWLADGLNHVTDYIAKAGLKNYKGATIEPKPNEPRGAMFLPTAGHAVGFIMTRLRKPDFWGVNPELLQHEGMTLLNSVLTVSYLLSVGKFKFLHFGSQVKGQFDDDFPPLVGPEGLKETVWMFRTLADFGWKGIVEFDCHMLRSDGSPDKSEDAQKRFIRACSEAVDIAVELASRLKPARKGASAAEADLASIRQMCRL